MASSVITSNISLVLMQLLYSAVCGAGAMDGPPTKGSTSPMPAVMRSEGAAWWSLSLPFLAYAPVVSSSPAAGHVLSSLSLLLAAALLMCATTALMYWAAPGGHAWGRAMQQKLRPSNGSAHIPGPRGWPIVGSLLDMGGPRPHVRLAELAVSSSARALMAFSLGNTRAVLTCAPEVARELLNSSAFADRPIKQSARQLMFHRAIGFAPYGPYWRSVRRIAATHLFCPRRIASHEPLRQHQTTLMLGSLSTSAAACPNGAVSPRPFLQRASVNNIMGSVFGRTYDFGAGCLEADMLQDMIREGFDLLGAFNWSDHLPWYLSFFDNQCITQRCESLVGRVKTFVQAIIEEHRQAPAAEDGCKDFVDVLLSLGEAERLSDSDMIAVLWEMIFRGTDTTAILTEWILAELILHPEAQRRIQEEIDAVVGDSDTVREADLPKLTYMQAVIKEVLRMHPPGPLLSWARLAIEDVHVAGHHIPAGTTAMVNMWAITHDPTVWEEPEKFKPERFLAADVDVRGNDLRLAPFGAGRRVCPGRALGYATVQLWTARLLHRFSWSPHPQEPVDLSEVLKLSCEMKQPLLACPTPRKAI